MNVDWDDYARKSTNHEREHDFSPAYRIAATVLSGTYLDLGAGDGNVVRSALRQGLLDRFPTCLACDISEVRVSRLSARSAPLLKAFVANAMSVPLPDASVDFVFSNQVIEHVPDDRAMAREIERILAPGGIAIVSSVVKRWYGWYYYRCGGKWRLDPTHVREYESLSEFERVFHDIGLTIVSSQESPMQFCLADLFVRALAKLGVLRGESGNRRRARALNRQAIVVRIPGYFSAEVSVRKSQPQEAR